MCSFFLELITSCRTPTNQASPPQTPTPTWNCSAPESYGRSLRFPASSSIVFIIFGSHGKSWHLQINLTQYLSLDLLNSFLAMLTFQTVPHIQMHDCWGSIKLGTPSFQMRKWEQDLLYRILSNEFASTVIFVWNYSCLVRRSSLGMRANQGCGILTFICEMCLPLTFSIVSYKTFVVYICFCPIFCFC